VNPLWILVAVGAASLAVWLLVVRRCWTELIGRAPLPTPTRDAAIVAVVVLVALGTAAALVQTWDDVLGTFVRVMAFAVSLTAAVYALAGTRTSA
jgi:hypothetical protein